MTDEPEKDKNENAAAPASPVGRLVIPMWKPLHGDSGHYNVSKIINESYSMKALKELFPEGEKSVNEMNFVLFSTSGVHGTYTTIEEAEEDEELSVTFLVIHPRLVSLRYGTVSPRKPDDFEFLKKLRCASWDIVKTIGV